MHSPDDSFRKLTSLTPIDSVSTSHAGFSIQRGRTGQFADDSFNGSSQYDGPSVKEKIFKYFFTTLLWGEKIYLNIFSPPYFGGRKYIKIYFHHRILGGKNIFQYIFTTVFCWEKIYFNIFSPPYVWGRKYISIYFHHRIFGGENISKYIFS